MEGSDGAGAGDGRRGRLRGALVKTLVLCLVAVGAGLAWRSLAARASPAKSDVVLIVIDALRPDHLSCYGYSRKTSPNIDALAADGTLFLDNKAQSGYTLMSMASMMKSRFVGEAGLGGAKSFDDFLLADIMSRAGWRAAGVQTNPWLSRPMGFARGFNDYLLLTPTENADTLKYDQWTADVAENTFYADAGEVADKCAELMAADTSRPLFLYAHLMDAHAPYIPPEAFQRFGARRLSISDEAALSGEWVRRAKEEGPEAAEPLREDVVSLYDAEILYADSAVGRIVRTLKDQGRYDGAVIIVAADHAEAFLDHGEVLHAWGLKETLLHTPLVMKLPGRAPARYEGLTRNVDIAPTILAAAGVDADWGRRDGVSLLGLLDDEGPGGPRVPIAESVARMIVTLKDGRGEFGSLQDGHWKYIHAARQSGASDELYDLAADPGEARDVAAEHPDTVAAMSARLSREGVADNAAAEQPVDPETARRLRALGYLN